MSSQKEDDSIGRSAAIVQAIALAFLGLCVHARNIPFVPAQDRDVLRILGFVAFLVLSSWSFGLAVRSVDAREKDLKWSWRVLVCVSLELILVPFFILL